MSLPFTSLSSATSTGVGESADLETSIRDHTMFVDVTGYPSTLNVDLEGSHDDTTWFALGFVNAGALNAGKARFNVSSDLIRYVRANLTALSGGTSPTVTATIASAS